MLQVAVLRERLRASQNALQQEQEEQQREQPFIYLSFDFFLKKKKKKEDKLLNDFRVQGRRIPVKISDTWV